MQRVGFTGMHGQRPETGVASCAEHPHGDLAAIGNQHRAQRSVTVPGQHNRSTRNVRTNERYSAHLFGRNGA